jgi:hypothetical protein
MAATILKSPRAVEMSVFVVRAFVRLRELLASDATLARKLDELERKYQHHDEAIAAILSAIRELMNPPESKLCGTIWTQKPLRGYPANTPNGLGLIRRHLSLIDPDLPVANDGFRAMILGVPVALGPAILPILSLCITLMANE